MNEPQQVFVPLSDLLDTASDAPQV